MDIYVEVNGIKYPASITGRLNDKDWDNRASKAITIKAKYEEVLDIFVNDVKWFIIEEHNDRVEKFDENGNTVFEEVINVVSHDNSEYSIAGDIINHRDGTVTVKMGKPTAEEILAIILGEVE